MANALMPVALPELHNPNSGRLDAQLIAGYLSVPLTRLAGVTGKKYASLHKTPDAPAVQDALFPIKRSLDILARVIEDRSAILAWLNSPHPDLGQRTPLQVLLEGHADAVEGMLEDAMAGMPA
jgi:Protein of unknown function (DUF2384)